VKRLLAFLLALGLGALAVSGGDEESLLAEIDRLNGLLRERLRKDEPRRAEEALVRTIYDVSDLCAPIEEHRLVPTNLTPSRYQPIEPGEATEPAPRFDIDGLCDLIRQTVDTESWDAIEGSDVMPVHWRLHVATVPRVHREVRLLLDWCRAVSDRWVSVDVVVVPIEPGDLAMLASRPRALEPEEAERLLARPPLGVARLLCHDARAQVAAAGRHVAYVRDYDVEIARDSSIGDPIPSAVFSGCQAEVIPCLDDGAEGVVLHCRLELTRVHAPQRKHATRHGEIDLPDLDLTRLETSFWAPLDRTVVAGGCTTGPRPCLFLVEARRLHSG
jgi:hypothetical protein